MGGEVMVGGMMGGLCFLMETMLMYLGDSCLVCYGNVHMIHEASSNLTLIAIILISPFPPPIFCCFSFSRSRTLHGVALVVRTLHPWMALVVET